MKKIITIFLLSTALLSGCATFDRATHTTDPVMGDNKVNNTTKGVENAGTVTEAIVGGGTGYYMDNQENILRGKLEKSGVRVLRQGNNIKLIMPANVTFEVNSSHINGAFYETLNSVSLVLNEFGNTRLKVYGYTDSQGDFEHNQLLSEDRARSVATYLVHQGVNPSRLYIQGMSERFPIASNDTKESRALNRRVELNIESVNL